MNTRFCASAVLGVIAVATTTSISVAADEKPKVVQGSLWHRAPSESGTVKTLGPVIPSTAKKPSATVCADKVCPVRITGIFYFQENGKINCTMTFDPDVLVVRKERVKIKWEIAETDEHGKPVAASHKFQFPEDIEFLNPKWKPKLTAGSIDVDLDFLDVPPQGHQYNVTAWTIQPSTHSGCKVDPLIVNTG